MAPSLNFVKSSHFKASTFCHRIFQFFNSHTRRVTRVLIEDTNLNRGSQGSVSKKKMKQNTSDNTNRRREKLPATATENNDINLLTICAKKMVNDLLPMPMKLYEPLSFLQRLCEELEYSYLLDKASSADNPVERMLWVAAFACSAYGSSNARARYIPLNPLLGETYECIREDRGFKYIAEQVSHHPPISACHAISKSWTWYQDVQVETKYRGKSLTLHPEGFIKLELQIEDKIEKYTWNKITACIRNLSSSERWVDLYGKCTISSDALSCNIDFPKASNKSSKNDEVFGSITDNQSGEVLESLFGKWSEGIYCGEGPSERCIWRPGALPEDADLYYGFSRFAIELNEITKVEESMLPTTDARFRPDQRYLEKGNITEAENLRRKIKKGQRDRKNQVHVAKWFSNENDSWLFRNEYWKARENRFKDIEFVSLW